MRSINQCPANEDDLFVQELREERVERAEQSYVRQSMVRQWCVPRLTVRPAVKKGVKRG